ncbi:MAG: hypothetical protein AAFR21_00750 [Pseudomonadota bacterium]
MFGNGIANIIAAAIIAAAILWDNGLGRKSDSPSTMDEQALAEMYARAVGDIRNDIVVNCGCCGDEEARPRRSSADSF